MHLIPEEIVVSLRDGTTLFLADFPGKHGSSYPREILIERNFRRGDVKKKFIGEIPRAVSTCDKFMVNVSFVKKPY